jgi:hypothetical protein
MLDTTHGAELTPATPAPRLMLDHHQLRELGITKLPRAGTDVRGEFKARVVHASTSDLNADGKLDAVTLVLEFDLAETCIEEVPEEREPESAHEARERRGAQLYETPRHKIAERYAGGSSHIGEFGIYNRRKGA